MDPLSLTASIIAVLQLTHDVTRYMSDVVDAPKQCQQCVIEASNLLGPLTSLKYRAEQADADDDWFRELRSLNIKDGPLDQYQQALRLLQSRTENKDSIPNIKRRLMWTFTKKDVASILGRIDRLKSLVSIALEMDHFKLSQTIKEDIHLLKNHLQPIQTDTMTMKVMQRIQHDEKIMQWLSPVDFAVQKDSIISRRQDGTAQWFVSSFEFKKWIDGEEKTLVCPGIPGAGKTMMAAVVMDFLDTMSGSDDAIGIAGVFCSYKATSEQSITSLSAALLKQLMMPRPDLIQIAKDLYDKLKGGKPSREEVYRTLESACSAFKTVFFVVDALDEYNEEDSTRAQFFEHLKQLQERTDLRILVTTRPLPVVLQIFGAALTLEVRASRADIERFVEGQLSRLPSFVQRDESLRYVVKNRITEAADGMFLLARLHVESLYDKRNKARLNATLDKISQRVGTLDQAYSIAYDEAFGRIDSQTSDDRSLAKRALCWVSLARRPMTADELCCGLAIEPGDRCMNSDNIYEIEDVISVCAGLLSMEQETSFIRLVHYTTQDYLEQVRLEWYPEAQNDIAVACLACLCFDSFQIRHFEDNKTFQAQLDKHAFYEYSAQYWYQHAQEVRNVAIAGLIVNFLCNQLSVDSVVHAESLRGRLYSRYSFNPSSRLELQCMYAMQATAGIFPLADGRLGPESFSQLEFGWTPLSWAAQNGHEAVIKLMLDMDEVDVDSKNAYGQTPLSLAAQNGRESAVQLLLATNKVEVNWRDDGGQTPLSLAAQYGRDAVVALLLKMDEIEINSRARYGQTPLSLAAQNGHTTALSLLLETKKVEVDSKDQNGRTPLSLAAQNGCLAILRLLLATGVVDVNSKDNSNRNSLSWAAQNGHEDVTHLLLTATDVEIDPRDHGGETPLMLAAKNGHDAIVGLLLATNKVNVDSKNNYRQSPLLRAAQGGYENIVRRLLKRQKYDIDSEDNFGHTSLSSAVSHSREAIVIELLKTNKVDVEWRDRDGRTLLSLAAERGNQAIVTLLLEAKRAAINMSDKDGWTPLAWASRYGHAIVVQSLLRVDGIQVDTRDRHDRTPLSLAMLDLHGEVISLLLGTGKVEFESGYIPDRL